MSAIVQRMSINYYIKQRKNKKNDDNERNPSSRQKLYKNNALSEEIVNVLGSLG